jgi:hypothetical protein
MEVVFIVGIFAVDDIIFFVVSEFDTNRFPEISRDEPGVAVPIPTSPAVPYMAVVFIVTVLRVLVAIRFVVLIFDEAYMFPWTCRVAPGVSVPIPTSPDVPNIEVVFI